VEAGAAGEHAEGLYTIWTRKLELFRALIGTGMQQML
jgi:hypothetical protein